MKRYLNIKSYKYVGGEYMKKMIASLVALTNLGIVNAADYSGFQMMGYPMMSGWVITYGLFYFVVLAFISSVIFWLTYKWLAEGKKRR